jgi:hypothetical protein
MALQDQIWNREELYDEVWSTPMQKVAKKYGISDVGLAKVCRKLAIPVPGRGHWAKKEAGQAVKQLPLPPLKEKVVLYKPTPRPEPPALSDLASQPEMAQVEQLERAVDDGVLKRGSLSHSLVLQARAVLTKAHVNDHKILWISDPCLDIRVSKESLERALRMMAAVIGIVENAGFTVAVETRDRKHQTIARIHGEEIRFGVVEKIDCVEISAPPKGGLVERVLTFAGKPVTREPSGKLSIIVWTAYGSDRKKWTDGKTCLEQQTSKIVAGFIRLALTDRAEREKHAAAERERQRIAQERADLEGQIKAESSKVRALRYAAGRWWRAEQIRSFIAAAREAAIADGAAADPGSPFGDWIIWAERQADRMDPLKESPPSIIDRIAEPEPAYPSYYGYGYRKPDPPFQFPKPIWRLK